MKKKQRSVNWNIALLRQNPFLDVPPRSPKEAVWAGMTALKEQLDRIFIEAQSTSASQVVLNFGAYGSGKTHAAIYYGLEDRMPNVGAPHVLSSHVLYVVTPKEPAQADQILYRSVLEAAQFRRIRAVIQEAIRESGDQQLLAALQELMGSEVLAKAIWLLGHDRLSTGQLSLFGLEEASPEWERILEAYFYSEYTKSDLRALGLSRGIASAQDRFRVLAGLIRSLTGMSPSSEPGEHCRVFLWIDEMEDLIYYMSRQYRPFTQAIKDLVDRLPTFFTLFLNFTLAVPEVLEDATVVLGQAIMSRVTHQIHFREPTQTEALEYVVDLLAQFRTESPEEMDLPKSFPFSDECLHSIIEMLPTRTPRAINNRCSEIASAALMEGIVSAQKGRMLDSQFVERLDKEKVSLEGE